MYFQICYSITYTDILYVDFRLGPSIVYFLTKPQNPPYLLSTNQPCPLTKPTIRQICNLSTFQYTRPSSIFTPTPISSYNIITWPTPSLDDIRCVLCYCWQFQQAYPTYGKSFKIAQVGQTLIRNVQPLYTNFKLQDIVTFNKLKLDYPWKSAGCCTKEHGIYSNKTAVFLKAEYRATWV